MKRPFLIALLGVDGSGKTTQARELATWLNARGTPARYRGGLVARRVFGVFRAPDLVLYCAVPAEVAQQRVEARGRDRETVAYLQAFADAYAALPEMATFVVIDATGTQAEVAAAIQSAVSQRLSA